VAAFTCSTTNGVAPLTVWFANQSSGATNYSWSFGDGNTSASLNPTNTYTNAGIYTVSLTAFGAWSNTLTRTNFIVATNPVPVVADFTCNPTSGIAPLTVWFTNRSSGATNYTWDFGDGKTSANVNPTNTYINAGNYTVKLTAVGLAGTNSLTRINFLVVTNPPSLVANFTSAPTNGLAPLTVWFTNQSSGATNYIWDFGDGKTSWSVNPSNTYTNSGSYTVQLTAVGPGGSNVLVRTNYILARSRPAHYVSLSGASIAPYTSWTAAATNIQDAIDAASDGDIVLVTNGVYATGGRAVYGAMTNRVVINKSITLLSVNGPGVTWIMGQGATGSTNNGDGAIRCVYVGANAELSGFTLTNGHTRASGDFVQEQGGGGVRCDAGIVTNCVLTGNTAAYHGGGSSGGTLYDCLFVGNRAAVNGGGSVGSTLINCTLIANSATYGGGAYIGALNNCILTANSAKGPSGPDYGQGGGCYNATLNNCLLAGNSAISGGGAYWGTLNNCVLTGNSAERGGGSCYGLRNNCTLTGNWATNSGGGVDSSTLYNCIVYFNAAPTGSNYNNAVLNFSCTAPLASGSGNITADPLLASDSHLSASSPCIGAGSINYAAGTDIDGEPWQNPPCMGADQPVAGATTGPLIMSISATATGAIPGMTVNFVAHNTGRISQSVWDFGDGTAVSNRLYISHVWSVPGNYLVRLIGYNDSYAGGVSATWLVVVTNPVPVVAGFTCSPTNGARILWVWFTNLSSGATNYAWDFGDGQTSTAVNPTKIYYDAGNYTVALTAFGLGGASTLIRTNFIIVTNPPPVVPDFACSPTNGLAPLTVWFTNLSSGATSYTWDFGDRSSSTNANPVHTYTNPGSYTVSLTAVGGWVDTLTRKNLIGAGMLRYVSLSGANVAPYTSWDMAATNIQDAINAASNGDSIVVTNGMYSTGGLAIDYGYYRGMTNRVAINKALTLLSVNGPAVTWIVGCGAGGSTTNGVGAVRCAYVGNSAVLSGFTLTNGHTENYDAVGGGAWCEVNGILTNCFLIDNSAHIFGGGSYQGTLNNCVLFGNSGSTGGGAAFSTLNNCFLSRNFAGYGGGSAGGTLNSCILSNNTANYGGGGSSGDTLTNCTLSGNSATNARSGLAGGAYNSTVNNCTFTGNSAPQGGGSYIGTLNNCTIVGNSAEFGGGSLGGTLNNCTVTGNSGLGAASSTLNNCIVYYNTPANYNLQFRGSIAYSCSTPLPPGTNNIDTEPQLASDSHLSAFSPCIAVGSSVYATGVDIDGEPWQNPPCIGVDQYVAGSSTGALSMGISALYSTVVTGYPVNFVAHNEGRINFSVWDFGDGNVRTNQAYTSHAWSTPGNYFVRLTGYNDQHPNGVSSVVVISVVTNPPLYYVNANNPSSAYPYTSWATAAQTIQDAADAAESTIGATTRLILVTNGVYSTGGKAVFGTITNRVAVTTGTMVRSINGPGVTWIVGQGVAGSGGNGDGAVRCAYVGVDSLLSGFTLTNGHTRIAGDVVKEQSGGGAWCEANGTLANCLVTGNSSVYGGGSHGGTVHNCTFTQNSAQSGGGSHSSRLNNCTLTGNSALVGGGSSSCTLKNCIVYYNTAPSGQNDSSGNLTFCCVTPAGLGFGNITNAPLFKDPGENDYRLAPTSPCIDSGLNEEWMFTAFDVSGNSRIINGTVDMGAYETPFILNLSALVQGLYDTNLHEMLLGNSTKLPMTSPYAVDPREVSAIPSNVVDWVLIELRGTNGNTVVAKSAFLENRGRILSLDGSSGITAEISAGYYFLVLKHRNHLPLMSAEPVAFTNYLVNYDFSTSASQSLGGTNDMAQLENGVWGMIAGDADGDGEILPVDALIYRSQTNRMGYHRGDFNLDGVVSANDLMLWTANQGRTTAVTNGETSLLPALVMSPGRKTLLAQATQMFTVSGSTDSVTWAMVKNRSGGTLTSVNATSVVYQAGSISNVVDIVEAWDGQDRLGRAFVNVISAGEVARAGKAIVIAGLRSFDDPLWPVNDYLGNLAYNTLLYRGYSKQNIRYLNPLPGRDVDGNGQPDDISLTTTLANVASTFTNWARNPDRLFIYMVDHGGASSGEGYFRLNASEILTASQLDAWLGTIQSQYSNNVVMVIDSCESGSFLAPLRYTGPGQRTVITACGTNEPTYYLAGGLVSFSDAFFGGLLIGLDLENSFLLAKGAISAYQSSWMDADGDGFYVSGIDPRRAAGVYIGPSFVAGQDVPQIGHALGNQSLSGTSQATLWAYDIVSEHPIDRVWCVVVPPGHDPDPTNPVSDLPILDLTYNAVSGRYEATYNGFTETGAYNILYYARDIWNSVSAPRQGLVIQAGFDERLVLVAGGTTNDIGWTITANMAVTAYQTARARRLDKAAIQYLSAATSQDLDGDGINDVAGGASLDSLSFAITNWATNAHKLTVYLVGSVANGLFRLNGSESLSAGQFDEWLDSFQSSSATVIVVMDFDGAGSYIPSLAAPPGMERVVMASTRAGAPSMRAIGGLISFSQFFLSGIFNGESLGRAFTEARTAIKGASGRISQTPQLDDNGNGIPDQKNVDGLLSAQRYLGAAFVTGEDAPFIGEVTPALSVDPGWPVLLWARDVWSDVGISNVWCVITPPDYEGLGDLPQINLIWNADADRYDAVYTNFTDLGTHVCTFFAQDNAGLLSSPLQCQVTTDAYEVDDTAAEAAIFTVGDTQLRNFQTGTDEDWVKFYAPTDFVFEVAATQLGTNSDLQLELYYEQPDGSLELINWTDDSGIGSNITEILTLDLKANPFGLLPGLYYLRISCTNSTLFGPGSEYALRIYVPIGPDGGLPWTPIVPIGSFDVGKFCVYMDPPQAVAAGGAWRVMELTNQNYYINTNTYGLPIASGGTEYHLIFRTIPGFLTPSNTPFVLKTNQTKNIQAYYIYTNLSSKAVSVSSATNSVFKVVYLGYAGKRQAIEESTNLLTWVPRVTNQIPSDGLLRFAVTNAPSKGRAFYRTRWVQ
jgi:PKD repeat protein